jgi:hypothetical protein
MCNTRGANEALRAVLFPAKEPSQRYHVEKSWGDSAIVAYPPTNF